jgi:hypothetical protein
MWCLRCGEREPGDQEKCKKCEYPIGAPENRIYLLQLMRMTGDLLCGNIDKVAYDQILSNTSKMLDEMHRGVLAIENKITSEELPESGRYVMSRPITAFKESIEIFSEAIEELRMYLVDPEEDHLRKGLKLVEKANNSMYYCYEVTQYAAKEVKRFMPECDVPDENKVKAELDSMISGGAAQNEAPTGS